MQPGMKVVVPDDKSGACVFVRTGDPAEVVEVEQADGSTAARDVGLVKYPDGCIKPWVFGHIRAA